MQNFDDFLHTIFRAHTMVMDTFQGYHCRDQEPH